MYGRFSHIVLHDVPGVSDSLISLVVILLGLNQSIGYHATKLKKTMTFV